MVADLEFAEAVFRCEISGELCMDGICSECEVALHFVDVEDIDV